MPTAIVNLSTSEFVPSGHAPDATFVVKDVPRNPDAATEKYSGNDADPIAAKTAQEIAAGQTALADEAAARMFDTARAFKATVLVAEANRLNKTLAQLTAAEIAAVRAKWIAAYKAL